MHWGACRFLRGLNGVGFGSDREMCCSDRGLEGDVCTSFSTDFGDVGAVGEGR